MKACFVLFWCTVFAITAINCAPSVTTDATIVETTNSANENILVKLKKSNEQFLVKLTKRFKNIFGARNSTEVSTSPMPSIINTLTLTPTVTVSKFPPVIEFIAQKIQSQFSNYVYEDLSRPQTYDRPVYTLAPDDIFQEELQETNSTSHDVIKETFHISHGPEQNTSIEIELEIKKLNDTKLGHNGLFVPQDVIVNNNTIIMMALDRNGVYADNQSTQTNTEGSKIDENQYILISTSNNTELQKIADIKSNNGLISGHLEYGPLSVLRPLYKIKVDSKLSNKRL